MENTFEDQAEDMRLDPQQLLFGFLAQDGRATPLPNERAAKRRLDLNNEKSPSAARALPAISGEPDADRAIHEGVYKIDSLQLSRRIISELLPEPP